MSRQLEKEDVARFGFERYSRISEELIAALLPPIQRSVHALIDCEAKDEDPVDEEALGLSEADAAVLTDLKAFNWSYEIRSQDGQFGDMLTDLDSILVNMKVRELEQEPSASPHVYLFDMTLDVKESIACFDNNVTEVLCLNRTKDNDRTRCRRSSKTNNGEQFNLAAEQCALDFVKVDGEYGERWAEEEHGDRFALPSARELVEGLSRFFELEVKERTKNSKQARATAVLE